MKRLALALVVLALLPLASLPSYLLFHTIAETTFIIVCFCVLLMAWTLRAFLDDDFPVFLGIAFAAAALLHVVHMVDFPGFGMISGPSDLDPPTQLWISARLLLAVSLVIAPFALGRRLPMRLIGLAYVGIIALVVTSIYGWDLFPTVLTVESGLTRFKIVAEYAVILLFALAALRLWRRRSLLQAGVLGLLIASLVAGIVAEAFFTLYQGPHNWPNLVGHLFLDLSAALVYLGVVEDGLARPHELAVKSLYEAERLHKRLERGLLPSFDLRRDDVTLTGEYRPGEGRLELGGDFLHVVDLEDDGVAVICGDVSGHGPDAAALATMLRVSWEALVLSRTPPSELIGALREVIIRERVHETTFATLCLAWIHPADDSIELVSLGHPLPLVLDGEVRRLEVSPEPPLGVVDQYVGAPTRFALPPGWHVFFYTDGLVEGRMSRGSTERFGEDRLIAALDQMACSDLDEHCITRLVAAIEDSGVEPFTDDVTVVLVGRR